MYPYEQPVSPRMQSKAPQQPSKISKLSLCNGHNCSVDPGDNQPVPVLLLLCSQSGLPELKVSFPSPSATKRPPAAALSFPQSSVRDGHPRCKKHHCGRARSVRVEKNTLRGSQPAALYFGWHVVFLTPSTTLTMDRNPRGSVIPVTPPVQSLTENTGNLSLRLVSTGSRLQRDHRAAPHHRVLHGASKRNESSPSQANKNKISPCVYKVQGTAQLWARALRKQDSFKAPGAAPGEQQAQDGPAKLPAAAAGPGSLGLCCVLPSVQGTCPAGNRGTACSADATGG